MESHAAFNQSANQQSVSAQMSGSGGPINSGGSRSTPPIRPNQVAMGHVSDAMQQAAGAAAAALPTSQVRNVLIGGGEQIGLQVSAS